MIRNSNGSGGGDNLSRLLPHLPLATVILIAVFVFASGLHQSLSFEALMDHHMSLRQMIAARPVVMATVYMLIYIAMVTLSIPASLFLTLTGGFLFGWPLGGALAAISATLGAASIFLIARTSLGEPILRRAGPRIQRWAAGFRADSFSYLLFLRLMPVMPFWITNLAAALFGMRLKTFILATLLGLVPVSYAFSFVGSGLGSVMAAHQARLADCLAARQTGCETNFRPDSLLTPELMIALALLGILALGPILLRKWQARGGENDH